jgi:hypothetical protein
MLLNLQDPARALELIFKMTMFLVPKMKATDTALDDINTRLPTQIIVRDEETKRMIESLG